MKVIKGSEKLEHILNTGMFRDRKQHLSHFHGFIHILYLPSEIFCITAGFVVCSLCSYECTDFELETAHEQVTITALIQNISLGRQKPINRECFHII